MVGKALPRLTAAILARRSAILAVGVLLFATTAAFAQSTLPLDGMSALRKIDVDDVLEIAEQTEE